MTTSDLRGVPTARNGRSGHWTPVVLGGSPHGFPGRLVAIEGSDGSGKSHFVSWLMATVGDTVPCTHVLMPGEHLRGYRYWQAWNDESLGIDRGLISGVGLSLMALGDRLVRQKAVIEPALKQGHLVICERYALTPLVFTSDPLFSEPLQQLFRPDLGLLFDAPSDVLFERVSARPDNAVHPQTRHDKDVEVGRFRDLAGCNGYAVVDTSSPNDYSGLRPLLRTLFSLDNKEDHADVLR
jgi:dTMP kinase